MKVKEYFLKNKIFILLIIFFFLINFGLILYNNFEKNYIYICNINPKRQSDWKITSHLINNWLIEAYKDIDFINEFDVDFYYNIKENLYIVKFKSYKNNNILNNIEYLKNLIKKLSKWIDYQIDYHYTLWWYERVLKNDDTLTNFINYKNILIIFNKTVNFNNFYSKEFFNTLPEHLQKVTNILNYENNINITKEIKSHFNIKNILIDFLLFILTNSIVILLIFLKKFNNYKKVIVISIVNLLIFVILNIRFNYYLNISYNNNNKIKINLKNNTLNLIYLDKNNKYLSINDFFISSILINNKIKLEYFLNFLDHNTKYKKNYLSFDDILYILNIDYDKVYFGNIFCENKNFFKSLINKYDLIYKIILFLTLLISITTLIIFIK